MQVATSPPPFKLPCSLSEPSSFDVLCLPMSPSNMSSFNTHSCQSTAVMTSRRLSSIPAVPNPCVDVIRLADSPSISPDSIRIKAASPSTRFLRQLDKDKEYDLSGTLKPAPRIIEHSRRRRRPIFSVAPDDDNPSFPSDSSETADSEDVFGGAQGSSRVSQGEQKIRPAEESSISDSGSRPSLPQSSTPRASSTDLLESPLHGLKPWHALTEIVSTELSYVYDLRKLAHVYFPALSALPLGSSTSVAVQRLGDNVSELLDFHESFLKSLQSVKKHGSNVDNLDDAVERIAQLFISKASQFDLYKSFCSSQPEVHTLLGAERVRFKTEWRLFEQQCAAEGSGSSSANVDATASNSCSETGHTTPASVVSHSISPLSPLSKTRIPSSSTFAFLRVSTSSRGLSETGRSCSGIQRSLSVDSVTMAGRRLRFHDFLIKPVQRLCRYPILIQSLRQSKTHSEHIDTALVQALQSMHAVTTRVDEAQRVAEETRKSKLIMDRIETHSVVSDEFLRSLKNCILAGPLDVAYHHHVYSPIDPPIRVRYMAAFLFSGGYLIFAKVSKNRSYRIKHWFNASSFEIVDIPEEEALVPHAFRLSCLDHHFEIAAACSSEKELWIQSIRKAMGVHNTWVSEPPSSLETRECIPSAASFSHLQSESGQFSPSKENFSSAPAGDDQQRSYVTTRFSIRVRPTAAPSGTAKVFSIGDGPPLLLKRSTAAERDLVDREMKDIQTVSITDCRIHAQTRSETMFPPPKFTQSVQVMAMASTNKLVRRGSWLLYRSRNPSSGPSSGVGSSGVEQEENGIVVSPSRRANRVGPSIAPSLSALHSEPECIDVVEKLPLSNEHEPIIIGSETMHELPSSSDGAQVNDPPRTSTRRRKNSFAAGIKGLVRKATSKRNSVQLAEDKLEPMAADVSQSRRRVSSAPPSPPQTSHEHETKDLGSVAVDGSLDSYHNLPCTASTSPLKPRSSLKKMIFRH